MKPYRRQAVGFSLVELLVATTIFLGLSIVVFAALSNSEGHKRATTSTNDIAQEGAYGIYQLGAWIRSAGSDFAQNHSQAYGCRIGAGLSGAQILPAASAFPAPFASIPQTLYLAPVLIYKNASQAGSDVLAVMAGNGGFEQSGQQLTSVPGSSALNPLQASTIYPNDLLLITDQPSSGSVSDCLIEQVAGSYSNPSTSVSLGGTYKFSGISGGKQLTDYSVNGKLADIGTISSSTANPPNFQLLGVGPSPSSSGTATNYSLFAYDVLQTGGLSAAVPVVDNVVAMKAIYGVDTNNDGAIDAWYDPGTSPYDWGSLTAATTTASGKLQNIKAVRIGLIMRTDIAEKTAVNNTAPTLFCGYADGSGNSLAYTLSGSSGVSGCSSGGSSGSGSSGSSSGSGSSGSCSSSSGGGSSSSGGSSGSPAAFDPTYRYRTYESTIPIRNNYLN